MRIVGYISIDEAAILPRVMEINLRILEIHQLIFNIINDVTYTRQNVKTY